MDVSAQAAANLGWVTGGIALFMLILRLGTHRYHIGRVDVSTYVVLLSLLVLTARLITNHFVLKFGTVYGLVSNSENESPPSNSEISKARMGTTLTLVTLLLVTTFYWLQCCILLLVYRRLVAHIPWVRHAIRLCWVAIAATYIAVILTTFLECHPFEEYYSPNLPQCSKAYAQLWVQCLSNVAIDLILLAISGPIFREQIRVFPRNLQLGVMFILGFFCIVVSCIRMSYVYSASSAQPTRSLWASVQALVATLVANVPSIYGAVKVRNRRGRSASASTFPMLRRESMGSQRTSLRPDPGSISESDDEEICQPCHGPPRLEG